MARRKGGLDFTRTHEKKKINFSLIREILIFAAEIAITVVLAFVLVQFLGGRTTVVGRSMEPTLYASDEVLINRFIYRVSEPKANDVVVFLPNGNQKSHYYIKRVIGVPGDVVKIEDGGIFVNGEPFQTPAEYDGIEDPGVAEEEIRLGTDEYFVLGDNVNSSEDSRFANIGNISKKYMIGKIWMVLKPKEHRGLVK